MKDIWLILLIYLAAVNLFGLIIMGVDKSRAKRRKWRIPEATLFLVAIIGGSVGSILGMYLFRHKTKHWYFRFGLPLILILHLAAFILLFQGKI